MGKKLERVRILVSGKVQGVGFRWWVSQNARDSGLVGTVKNLKNGMVEIIAEGKKEKLLKLVNEVREGSPLSEVEDVDVSWQEFSGEYSGFEIIS